MNPLDVLTLPLDGRHLVEASAGTGKTFAITALVLRLLLERRLSLEEILVVTFTRAATAELKQRIRRRIQEAARAFADPESAQDELLVALARRSLDPVADRRRLEQAILISDQASVMTIHGYCQRVLEDYAFESGMPFDVELVPDVRSMLRELVEDWWATTFAEVDCAELEYAASRGFTLDAAEALAASAIAMPIMSVVTSRAPPVSVGDALSRYYRSRRHAAASWADSRGEVAGLLLSSGSLHGSKYRRDYLEQWLAALDGLLAQTHDSYDGWFDKLEKFTPPVLEASTKKGGQTPRHPFFSLCQELLEAREVADAALRHSLEAKKSELISWARAELSRRKAEERVQTFDDLLSELSRVLSGPGGDTLAQRLARRHGAALIDEFQDTDPVQYEIFQRVYRANGTSLFLVGDPKQAIYAFRGADIFAYLRAVADTPPERQWTMGTNWRSDPGLVAAVNFLFGACERPFLLEGIDYHPVAPRPAARDELTVDDAPAPPLEILYVSAEGVGAPKGRLTKIDWARDHLPELVAADICQVLAGKTKVAGRVVTAADVAVLTRTNDQASAVQRELQRLGIPSVLGGSTSVLDSDEAFSLGAVMRAIAAPGTDDWIWTALASAPLGVCAEQLAAARSDVGVWEQWVERFSRWHDAWQHSGFMRAFRAVTTELEVPGRLLGTVGGQRALTNWLHLSELLHHVASTKRLGMAALIEWFDRVRLDPEARREIGAEDQQIRLESDASAVQLATMHRSKGLEYPLVYCPYLWEPAALRDEETRHLLFHDPAEGLRLKLDIRSTEDKSAALAQAKDERLAEYLRLAYVALTRARHQCRIVWGLFTGVESSSLAHLLHRGFRGRHGESGPDRLDEPRMLEQLRELVRDARGAVGLRDLEPMAVEPLRPALSALEWRGRRALERTVRLDLRTSSFSALTAEHEPPSRDRMVGRDRDELVDEEAGADGPLSSRSDVSSLLGFPRGARSGELLHAILENVDFTLVLGEISEGNLSTEPRGDTELERVVRERMALHGFDYEEWGALVCRCIRATVDVPLDGVGAVRLGRVARNKRLSELEFILPVPSPSERGLSARSLAEAFELEAVEPVVKAYAADVRRLEFAPLSGFLRGFIDLVFELDGRWYIVDYKSNDLGDELRDYHPQNLARSMVSHHYILQYHLYVLALHRYLEHRLRGYQYDRDFGGVYYLFLRGLDVGHGQRAGIWFDRPPLALVERLLDTLDSGHVATLSKRVLGTLRGAAPMPQRVDR